MHFRLTCTFMYNEFADSQNNNNNNAFLDFNQFATLVHKHFPLTYWFRSLWENAVPLITDSSSVSLSFLSLEPFVEIVTLVNKKHRDTVSLPLAVEWHKQKKTCSCYRPVQSGQGHKQLSCSGEQPRMWWYLSSTDLYLCQTISPVVFLLTSSGQKSWSTHTHENVLDPWIGNCFVFHGSSIVWEEGVGFHACVYCSKWHFFA